MVAFDGNKLVGMVSYAIGKFYEKYEPVEPGNKQTGYIVEILVHPDYLRKGIGTELLEQAKSELLEKVDSIYAKHHEENKASAELMRKVGFQVVDVFLDPLRTIGSCKTVVEQFRASS